MGNGLITCEMGQQKVGSERMVGGCKTSEVTENKVRHMGSKSRVKVYSCTSKTERQRLSKVNAIPEDQGRYNDVFYTKVIKTTNAYIRYHIYV